MGLQTLPLLILANIIYLHTKVNASSCSTPRQKYIYTLFLSPNPPNPTAYYMCYDIDNNTPSGQCYSSPPYSCQCKCYDTCYLDNDQCCTKCHKDCYSCQGSGQQKCITCSYPNFKNDTTSKKCVPIQCNDNYTVLKYQQCDDGNEDENDGCNKCILQPNFRCYYSNVSNLTRSECRYQVPIWIDYVSAVKDPYSNFLKITLSINTTIPYMSKVDFNKVIQLGFSVIYSNFTYYQNGTIIAQAIYTDDHDSQRWYELSIDFSNSEIPMFSNFTTTKVPYQLYSLNNLAINFYSPSTYSMINTVGNIAKILSIIAISTFLSGMVRGKVIAVQLVAILQLSYCGIFLVKYADPLFFKMWQLHYSNGYNLDIFPQTNMTLTTTMQNYQIQYQMIRNLNIMLGIPILLILVSLTFFIFSKLNFAQHKAACLEQYAKMLMGEYFYISLTFLAYPVSFYLGITIRYFTMTGILMYISLASGGAYLLVLLIVMILFTRRNEDYFGQLILYFKHKKFYHKYYFSLHILQRVIIGMMLGVAYQHPYCGIGVAVILILHAICIGIFRPYGPPKDNWRSMFVMIAGAINISLYTYLAMKKPGRNQFAINTPLFVLVILSAAILVSLISIIFQIKRIIYLRCYSLSEEAQPNKEAQKGQLEVFEEQMKKRLQNDSKRNFDLSKLIPKKSSLRKNKLHVLENLQLTGVDSNEDALLQRIVNFQKYQDQWIKTEQLKCQLLQEPRGQQQDTGCDNNVQEDAKVGDGPQAQ